MDRVVTKYLGWFLIGLLVIVLPLKISHDNQKLAEEMKTEGYKYMVHTTTASYGYYSKTNTPLNGCIEVRNDRLICDIESISKLKETE